MTCEKAWKVHLWTLVRGQVSRTALANPLPPSVTTISGAGIGDMRADHALEFSDLAMYQETTLSPLQHMSTTRSRATQIPSTWSTRCSSPSGTGMGGLATLMWTVPGGARETGGPYMRDPRHPRHFTDEFKRQIVDLYNAGKPKREIMDEYDLGKSTVERWIKSINATGSPRAADNRTPEQNRILELERENRRLRMEVDVLKQAALIYARK